MKNIARNHSKFAAARLGVALLSAGLLFAGVSSALADSTLTNGLVAYWPFDASVGTNTPDLALNNSLWEFGSPSLVAGERGNCFQLNGTSQFLGLVHTTNNVATGLPIYSQFGYTVAFWVNAASTIGNNKTMFSEGTLNNSGMLFNIASSTGGKMLVLLRNNVGTTVMNNIKSTKVVFDGTWHHIAFADMNGSNTTLYIDGVPDATSFKYTNTVITPLTASDTSVGALYRATPVNFFTGMIDEVMGWNRVLSQSEIQNAMSNGIPEPIAATPPIIVSQPISLTNSLGDRPTFSVNVFGNQPMSYQWYSNTVALPNQTNSSLTLTSLTSPGTSDYDVVATNSAGSVTSVVATLTVLPDATPNVSSGLVSYWPFDTLSNSISTPDLVSQDDFQVVNMTSANIVPGKFGNALSFDGSTQYGYETNGTPIYSLSTTYTVAFWVNGAGEQSSYRIIFANGNPANGNYFLIGNDPSGATGKLDVRVSPPTADTLSTATVLDGTWHHVVWVDQDGTGLLYIDGVLDSTIYNYTRSGTITLSNTTVGALEDSTATPVQYYFAGAIDDLGTWNRRLSYTEIQSILSSGIPAPSSAIKPSLTVTTQPANLASGIYQGDNLSLSVSASGTSPFSYQWEFNNAPISGNPSSLTSTLTLSNAQPAQSGSYTVVVTNAGGATTSSVVSVSVIPYIPATNGTALKVEFNYAAGPVVQPGFASMTLSANPASFNGPKITLSPIGATSLADRARTVPTNNPPALTQADIYQQFIFSTANVPGTGVDLLIQRLAPNTVYGLTMWSYDQENSGYSDWTEVSSGTPVNLSFPGQLPIYTFSGPTPPATNGDDTFGGLLTSSATGTLDLQGVVDPNNTAITVFINALQLVANPGIQITSSRVAADGNLQLIVTAQYPWQQIDLMESPTINPASWSPASDAIVIGNDGPYTTVEFPMSSSQMFYRAVSP